MQTEGESESLHELMSVGYKETKRSMDRQTNKHILERHTHTHTEEGRDVETRPPQAKKEERQTTSYITVFHTKIRLAIIILKFMHVDINRTE